MQGPEIVTRYEGNPILTAKDIPGGANAVYNTAVTKYNGKYYAILRVETKTLGCNMTLATSDDGINFKIGKPVLQPKTEPFLTYEKYMYDPRITKIGNTYYIAYAIENEYGCQCALSKTKDFKTFQKVSILTEIENRNVVIFPEKIKGLYWRLDRPWGASPKCGIWCATSPDLVHWGNHRALMMPRFGYWDGYKLGAGAPPIRTKKGWLLIYHGCHLGASGMVYRLGTALLDLKDPSKLIRRSSNYILSPEKDYEIIGQVMNVCFINAAIVEKDGTVKMYYGGADTVVGLATAKLDDLIKFALKY